MREAVDRLFAFYLMVAKLRMNMRVGKWQSKARTQKEEAKEVIIVTELRRETYHMAYQDKIVGE